MSDEARSRTRAVAPVKTTKVNFATEVKVVLKFPIEIGGTKVSEVTVRRPKVKDRLAIASSTASEDEREIAMLGNLCQLSPSEVEDLDLYDFVKIQEVIMGFIGSATPTN